MLARAWAHSAAFAGCSSTHGLCFRLAGRRELVGIYSWVMTGYLGREDLDLLLPGYMRSTEEIYLWGNRFGEHHGCKHGSFGKRLRSYFVSILDRLTGPYRQDHDSHSLALFLGAGRLCRLRDNHCLHCASVLEVRDACGAVDDHACLGSPCLLPGSLQLRV